MKFWMIVLALLCISTPNSVFSAEPNAGFVEGIWYASETVFADTPTRIYVAFRNNTPSDLTGTIRFTDNGKRIGTSEVSALSGRLVEAWVDWKPTYGEHSITAVVSEATLHPLGGASIPLDVTRMTAEDTLFVDYDTDKDGVGNNTDTDDDNDGMSDDEEAKQGTSPIVPNPKPTTKTTDEENTSSAPNHTTASTSRINQTTTTESSSTTVRQGLERYVGDGTVDTLLTNFTEKIEDAKASVDTYRKNREAKATETLPAPLEHSMGNGTTSSDGTSSDMVITRTIAEKKGPLTSLIDGIRSLISSIWTFILFILSTALARPALVEILFLLFILFILYRTMRRLGRRQN